MEVTTPDGNNGQPATTGQSRATPDGGRRGKVRIGSREWEAEVAERLRTAAGMRSLRQVAAAAELNWETVRRSLSRGRVSGKFLAAFCEGLGVGAEWVLLGHGPMRGACSKEPTPPVAPLAEIEAKGRSVVVRKTERRRRTAMA